MAPASSPSRSCELSSPSLESKYILMYQLPSEEASVSYPECILWATVYPVSSCALIRTSHKLPPTIHKQPLNMARVRAGSNRVQTQRRLDKVMSTKLTNQSIVMNEAVPSLIPAWINLVQQESRAGNAGSRMQLTTQNDTQSYWHNIRPTLVRT